MRLYVFRISFLTAAVFRQRVFGVRLGDEAPGPEGCETTLAGPAKVGDTMVDVADSACFAIGDAITVGMEVNAVVHIGSIFLSEPLSDPHPAGATVKVIEAALSRKNAAPGPLVSRGLVETADESNIVSAGKTAAATETIQVAEAGVQTASAEDSRPGHHHHHQEKKAKKKKRGKGYGHLKTAFHGQGHVKIHCDDGDGSGSSLLEAEADNDYGLESHAEEELRARAEQADRLSELAGVHVKQSSHRSQRASGKAQYGGEYLGGGTKSKASKDKEEPKDEFAEGYHGKVKMHGFQGTSDGSAEVEEWHTQTNGVHRHHGHHHDPELPPAQATTFDKENTNGYEEEPDVTRRHEEARQALEDHEKEGEEQEKDGEED